MPKDLGKKVFNKEFMEIVSVMPESGFSADEIDSFFQKKWLEYFGLSWVDYATIRDKWEILNINFYN